MSTPLYYLAVDIGASSGRHVLGSFQNGKIVLEEMYRFPNGMKNVDGMLCWDTAALFNEILTGLAKCKDAGKIPVSMGIDTWGVDFVLLDKQDKIVGQTVAYRDHRTDGMYDIIDGIVSPEEMYAETGLQRMVINSVCQLMAIQQKHPQWMEQAESLLLMPDYFNFCLTGVKKSDYTNSSTTQLLSAKTKDWAWSIIDKLGFPRRIFGKISMPGTCVGNFSEAIRQRLGFDCTVMLTASHDTASAVLAVPSNVKDVMYISSGTWSLFGTELTEANCSMESMKHAFTNEGGYDYRFRYLKNIMGMWIMQSVKKDFDGRGEKYSFDQMNEMARQSTISSIVNCDDASFFSPESMTQALSAYCEKTHQQVPKTVGEYAAVTLRSLAQRYAIAVKELEEVTKKHYTSLHIVGGGSQNTYLNELTAKVTGKDIWVGPVEATSLGNIAVQMIAAKHFTTVEEIRNCIRESFDVTKVAVQ